MDIILVPCLSTLVLLAGVKFMEAEVSLRMSSKAPKQKDSSVM